MYQIDANQWAMMMIAAGLGGGILVLFVAEMAIIAWKRFSGTDDDGE